MRMRLFFALWALVGISFPASAETRMPGYPCTVLGATLMADDNQKLVACLSDGLGNTVWKSMSGGGCYVSYGAPTSAADPSGACLQGFTNKGSIGSWGSCSALDNSAYAFQRPPGASCVDTTGWSGLVKPSGGSQAYVCCQN